MVKFRNSDRFVKALRALGHEQRKRAEKSLLLMVDNPRHPSLHFEKLSSGVRTIRVDRNFRIVLKEVAGEGDTFDLLDVDTHTKVYQRY